MTSLYKSAAMNIHSFRELKYTIGLSCLHGKKTDFLLQEVFVRLILYNYASLIARKIPVPQEKQINFSVAILVCKQFLKGKIRTILLPGKLCRKLLKYARKNKTVSGEIFLTRNGTSLSRRQIWAELKRLCKYAGVEPTKVFPHNLRHLFATIFYKSCKDIARLADVLGHSSIETTRTYLVTSGTEHARQLDRLGLVS